MSVTSTIRRQKPGRSYFSLNKAFPLTSIENKAHLIEAQSVVDGLLARVVLDAGEELYLNALTDLIESYEDEHESIPAASEADMLRILMQANGLSQNKLAILSEIPQSTISAILSGGRPMTKKHMHTLGEIFNVSPAAFFNAGSSVER